MGEKMASGKFAHLAGADQVHGLTVKRSENLLGEFDSDRRHGNGGRSNSGLCPDALGNRECSRQERIEMGMHGAHGAGHRIGLLDLTENLRLSNDHRVETGSHTKQVADSILLAVLVQVGVEVGSVELKVLADERAQVHTAILRVGEKLNPVAGGENETFLHSRMLAQTTAGFSNP